MCLVEENASANGVSYARLTISYLALLYTMHDFTLVAVYLHRGVMTLCIGFGALNTIAS